MATELTMPQMGYDMQEGTVVRWLKLEGAQVEKGEVIAEIETDKAVVEFQSYADGLLRRILVAEGGTVPVGQAIAVVGEADEDISAPASAPAPASGGSPEPAESNDAVPLPPANSADEAPVADAPVAEASDTSAPAADVGRVRASPVARKIAEERGVDLSQIVGTGPGGRITREDVEGYVPDPSASPTSAPAPAAAIPLPAPGAPAFAAAPVAATGTAGAALEGDMVPLSRMRKQIAKVTVRSKTEAPHFYVAAEVDMTQAMEMRRQINASPDFEGAKVSVNDLILKACIGALKAHPKFNATFTGDGIQMHEHINIGMAIAEDEGLIVPAIRDAHDMSLKQLAIASRDLAVRSRGGSLTADEYTSGTFTVSNLGMFDVTSFTAIIYPPQSAVVAVGSVAKKPVVRGDKITVADIMTATLSADHRIVDGAEGALFIGEVKSILENPYQLLV
jgi:pyruvate dehydrogenase E2 component (dihydrolipoamide acetyltransferase)